MSKINKKIYCSNCGLSGHVYKKCDQPSISIGIIAFTKTKNKIKYLFIQRKHTLGYMEFMRGRYFLNNKDTLKILFWQMTPDEVNEIINNSFDTLWNNIWLLKKGDCKDRNYKWEYEISKSKFMKLKESGLLKSLYEEYKPLWDFQEWGFPKGKRNLHEDNISCAKREFTEETNYNDDKFKVLDDIKLISEDFFGTNGIIYRNQYFVAYIDKKEIKMDDNQPLCNEINKTKWMDIQEALSKIRPYHIEKFHIIKELDKKLQKMNI